MALASQLASDRENGKRSALGKSSNHRAHYLSTLHERPSDILRTNKYRLHRRLVFARFLPTLRNIPSTAQTTFMPRESEKKETVPFFWKRGLNPFVPSWSVAKEIESNLQVQDLGGLVWHYDPQLKPGEANKFHHQWEGPYEIVELVTDVTFSVKNARGCSRKSQVVHISNLQLYK